MLATYLRNAAAAAAAVALLGTIGVGTSSADEYIGGWQKKHPVVKYGVIPVETQSNTMKSMDAFIKHAEKETGDKREK